MSTLPLRPGLENCRPYGAPELDVPARLNVNENPYAPSPAVIESIASAVAAAAAGLNRYPDRDFPVLREALADYLAKESAVALPPERIWAANGSNEVMLHLLQAFGGPGRTCLSFTPTYSMYDPAFQNPTKPIGPVYSKDDAERNAREKGWNIAPDGNRYRRVVPSPRPQRISQIRPIQWLLQNGTVVVCGGGGGIPTCRDEAGRCVGVEAVIDKDLCSSLLAQQLHADLLVIATDVDATYMNWGKPDQQAIAQAHPQALAQLYFAAGSMGPKIQAACEFAENTGKTAVIGALADIEAIVRGEAGTQINTQVEGIRYRS